ncbi:MAG: virulence factor SrfC family protein [Azospirillaceae bacterium]|nr:virulence factor SrfC family protein [Azospirillaceae bacterium]
MALNNPAVAAHAATLAEVARDGAQWLDSNAEALRLDRETLAQSFRRFARRARRLQQAVDRPTAVAVFGASQAGKSYLVSSLAAPRNKPLVAAWGTERLDFLKDLNPEGGKESTGLVSRFTMRRPAAPAGAPVPLLLLTQTDVVKILANTFLEDFQLPDMRPPAAAEIDALFNRLEPEARPTPVDRLTIDDIEELREYFETYFRGKELIRALGASYWTRAARVIPRLPADRRAAAFAPLWNGTEAFTRVLEQATTALSRLGFPDFAFCDTTALRRDGGNLLDAATVLQLGMGASGEVRVSTASGATAMLDRTILTALIAEVTVPVEEKPWDFFDHTDLLDFPGARSRKDYDSVDKAIADKDGLGGLFLRGKVAYLFQRYNAEQEISAMLLCVGNSVQEVSTLPRMVTGWIDQTLGAGAVQRARQRNSLFLVLTKFDMELDGKRGEDPASGQRWTNRLTASLIEPFGQFDWVTAWAPGRPFDNCFWLRSKAVPCLSVYDYAADGTETPAPRGVDFLAVRHAPYLENALVRTHFRDPEQAWRAVLTPNDGGVAYLAAALRPICDPVLKQEQITGRLIELGRDIDTQLRPNFHTGDLAAELERARAAAKALAAALINCARAQMFGLLLNSLQVTQDQVTSIYWRAQSEAAEAPLQLGTTSAASAYFDELAEVLGPATAIPEVAAPRDRFEQLADLAIGDWTQTTLSFAEDPQTEHIFKIPREQAVLLAGEMARAARRLDLRGTIARTLHQRASYQQRSAVAVNKPVMIIEQAINNFVFRLGYDRLPAENRPRTTSGRSIFAPRPPVRGMPELGPKPTDYDRTFHVDWITAIARTIEENVQDVGSGAIDIAQNAALGDILQRLAGAIA